MFINKLLGLSASGVCFAMPDPPMESDEGEEETTTKEDSSVNS